MKKILYLKNRIIIFVILLSYIMTGCVNLVAGDASFKFDCEIEAEKAAEEAKLNPLAGSSRSGYEIIVNYSEGMADNQFSASYNDAFYVANDLSNDISDIQYFELLDSYNNNNNHRCFVYAYKTYAYKDGKTRGESKEKTYDTSNSYVMFPEVYEEQNLETASENTITVLASYCYSEGKESYHELIRLKESSTNGLNFNTVSKTIYSSDNAANSKEKAVYYTLLEGTDLYVYNAATAQTWSNSLKGYKAGNLFNVNQNDIDSKNAAIRSGFESKYDIKEEFQEFCESDDRLKNNKKDFDVDIYDYSFYRKDADNYIIFLDITASIIDINEELDDFEVFDEDGNLVKHVDDDEDIEDIADEGLEAGTSYDFIGTISHMVIPDGTRFDNINELDSSTLNNTNYFDVISGSRNDDKEKFNNFKSTGSGYDEINRVYTNFKYRALLESAQTGVTSDYGDTFSNMFGYYNYVLREDGVTDIFDLKNNLYKYVCWRYVSQYSLVSENSDVGLILYTNENADYGKGLVLTKFGSNLEIKSNKIVFKKGLEGSSIDNRIINAAYKFAKSDGFYWGFGYGTYNGFKTMTRGSNVYAYSNKTYNLVADPDSINKSSNSHASIKLTGDFYIAESFDEFIKNTSLPQSENIIGSMTGVLSIRQWKHDMKTFPFYTNENGVSCYAYAGINYTENMHYVLYNGVLEASNFVNYDSSSCITQFLYDDCAVLYNTSKNSGVVLPYLVPLTSLSKIYVDNSWLIDGVSTTANFTTDSSSYGKILKVDSLYANNQIYIVYIYEKAAIIAKADSGCVSKVRNSTKNGLERVKDVSIGDKSEKNKSLSKYYTDRSLYTRVVDLTKFNVTKTFTSNEIFKITDEADYINDEDLSDNLKDLLDDVNVELDNSSSYSTGFTNFYYANKDANADYSDEVTAIYSTNGISLYDTNGDAIIRLLTYDNLKKYYKSNNLSDLLDESQQNSTEMNWLKENWNNIDKLYAEISYGSYDYNKKKVSMSEAIKEEGMCYEFIVSISPCDKSGEVVKETSNTGYYKLTVSDYSFSNVEEIYTAIISSKDYSKIQAPETSKIDTITWESIIRHLEKRTEYSTELSSVTTAANYNNPSYSGSNFTVFNAPLIAGETKDSYYSHIVCNTPENGMGIFTIKTTGNSDVNSGTQLYTIPTFQHHVITNVTTSVNEIVTVEGKEENKVYDLNKSKDSIENLSQISSYGIYTNDLDDTKADYQYLIMGFDNDEFTYTSIQMIRAKMIPMGVGYAHKDSSGKTVYYRDFVPVGDEGVVYYLPNAYYDEYGRRIVDNRDFTGSTPDSDDSDPYPTTTPDPISPDPENPTPTNDPTDPTQTNDPVEPTPTKDPTEPTSTKDPGDATPTKDPTEPTATKNPTEPTSTKDPGDVTPTKDPTEPTSTKDPGDVTPTKDPTEPTSTKDPGDVTPTKDPTEPTSTKDPGDATPTKDPTEPTATKDPGDATPTKDPTEPTSTKDPGDATPTKDPTDQTPIPGDDNTSPNPSSTPNSDDDSENNGENGGEVYIDGKKYASDYGNSWGDGSGYDGNGNNGYSGGISGENPDDDDTSLFDKDNNSENENDRTGDDGNNRNKNGGGSISGNGLSGNSISGNSLSLNTVSNGSIGKAISTNSIFDSAAAGTGLLDKLKDLWWILLILFLFIVIYIIHRKRKGLPIIPRHISGLFKRRK